MTDETPTLQGLGKILREGKVVVHGKYSLVPAPDWTEGHLIYAGRADEINSGYYELSLENGTREGIYVIGVPSKTEGSAGNMATVLFRPGLPGK